MNWLFAILNWLFPPKIVNHEPIDYVPLDLTPPPPPPPRYLWDTPAHASKSVRIICDEMGLTLKEKDLIWACVKQESEFKNWAVNKNYKRDKTTGKYVLDANGDKILLSTDWGICQINDTPGWHIGKDAKFPTVKYVLDNPDKCIRYMIAMYKQGKLKLWVSYSSGAYRKYLPK